jgi:hypothetical protein
MITPEKIQENYKEYVKLVNENFTGERLQLLQSINNELEDRLIIAPASPKDWNNNAFVGGYLDHILRVNKVANQLYKLYNFHGGNTSNYTLEELNFVSLYGQLGKIGDKENDYLQPNDSDWHIKNMGMVYKYNPNIDAMKVYDRTIFLLQDYGVKISQNEYIAIRTQEGLYDDSNKFYYYSGQKETKLRNHLPLLLHHAIQISQEIEFEIWNTNHTSTTSASTFKPANATKADKGLRKAKAINMESHPQFSDKTKSIIDSFFNNDEE